MKSIAFPKMFTTSSTLVKSDYDASSECIHLLLGSERGTFTYDPFFGIKLKRYTFNQNDYVLRDQIIDEILTALANFAPQLKVERKNIGIKQSGARLTATIKATNMADYTTDMYDLVLMDAEQ